MLDLPIAIQTVHFGGYAVSGQHLAGLVQQVANRMGTPHTVFFVEAEYHNGTVRYIGQAGEAPHRHIRVVPSLDGPGYTRFGEHYKSVEVTSFSWYPQYRETPKVDDIVREVIEFAAELKRAFVATLTGGIPDFPEYVDPVPIPWETAKA